MLINTLLSAAMDGAELESLLHMLDNLAIRPKIQSLMTPPCNPDLTTPLLDFQSNILRFNFQLRHTSVNIKENCTHRALWSDIWASTSIDGVDESEQWSILGLKVSETDKSSQPTIIWKAGRFGLDCLHSFATRDKRTFSRVSEQSVEHQAVALVQAANYLCMMYDAYSACA